MGSIFELWGKTSACDTSYHPLICHMIDTANVSQAIWDNVLPETVKELITTSLNIPTDATRTWISFLAGLHDIGKATPGFQRKNADQLDRLKNNGYEFYHACHDHRMMSAYLMKRIFNEELGGLPKLDRKTNLTLKHALGGHHGSFLESDDLNRLSASDAGFGRWSQTQAEIVSSLSKVTGIDSRIVPHINETHRTPFFILFTGLTTVADWISSSETFFPYYRPGTSLETYTQISRSRAKNALDELNWLLQDEKTDRSFIEAFSFITDPYPLQDTIDKMSAELEDAGMVIVEAPMGEGKTEAAFYLMERMNRKKNNEKVYIGMPTQATSNQMFQRVCEYLHNRTDVTKINLALVHGHAVMSDKLKQIEVSSVGDEADNIAANEWFTYKKRGILSPYGVGTIDQSLLAILSVKHFYVRLFGLAGKTVIFDEVHAYDVYMSTLLDRLLKWLSALNTNVIILSATLPSDRKNQLLKAYSGKNVVNNVAYPRISWTRNDNTYAQGFSSASEKHGRPSRVHLQFIDQDTHSLAHRLNDTLAAGGKAAVICNTVKKAQNMYVELKRLLDEDIDIDILHARYMLKDRKQREEKCLSLFGKSIAQRNSKHVLVSTQIIEQSLDLDFDLMITELAPVDLLIQRSGRLHRHCGKQRPPKLESPMLLILNPDSTHNMEPDFGTSERVYSEYILLKSFLLLKDKEYMHLPEDIEKNVEAVYVNDLEKCPSHLIERLKEAEEKWLEDKKKMQKEAEWRIIGDPDFDRPWKLMANLLKEDDPEIHKMLVASTRLAPPSVSLICLFETPNGLALDEEGLQMIDIAKQPTDEEVHALLDNSISLSNKRIVEHLLQERVPESWKRSSLLNRYRAIVFQKDDMSETYIYKSGNIYIIHDKNIGMHEG